MTEQMPPPKKHGPIWRFMFEKPPDWDKPANRISRWVSAIVLGLGLLWIRSRY